MTRPVAPMLRVAFAGAFPVCFADRVRAHLGTPCDVILADQMGIVSRLPEVDVLVTLAFTREMGAAAMDPQPPTSVPPGTPRAPA